MLAQDRAAQPVDRRYADPIGAIGSARDRKALAQPLCELAGRALGEGDDEDRLGIDAVLDGTRRALDEHRRLAASRAGRDEHDASRVDRLLLCGAELDREIDHARATLQIGCASHQEGHSWSGGSWRTSPRRIRATAVCAVSTASATIAQKASSSR